MKNIMDIDTVSWNADRTAVRIIDQTLLPGEIVLKDLMTAQEMYDAILRLEVRGAPAIGVFAAMSLAVLSELGEKEVGTLGEQVRAAHHFGEPFSPAVPALPPEDPEGFHTWLHALAAYLNSSRPTAVNLSWALKRMTEYADTQPDASRAELVPALLALADQIREEDIRVCRAIGENGLTLVHPGDGILTHCNAGKLATVRYGTATAPIYLAEEKGYHLRVFCDETRPLLQGARLTAFELQSSGVDTTLICDNMSGRVMKNGWINAIFVGCDRVAANGDTANKIGTSVVAAVAKYYGVPLYICAPTSTIDLSTATGDDIVVEERNPDEVTEMWYAHRMAPEGVKVFNPAFDVTDHELIAGFVTEYGVIRAPYEENFRELFRKKAAGD